MRKLAMFFSLTALLLVGALSASYSSHTDAAVVYSNAAKSARLQSVCTTVDSGGAAGVLEIGTNSGGAFNTVLAQFTLNYNPACTVGLSGGNTVLTWAGFPKTDSSANNTGTAAWARICTSAGCSTGSVITGLTVGLTGSGDGTQDVELDSTNITAGQQVTISAGQFVHP